MTFMHETDLRNILSGQERADVFDLVMKAMLIRLTGGEPLRITREELERVGKRQAILGPDGRNGLVIQIEGPD